MPTRHHIFASQILSVKKGRHYNPWPVRHLPLKGFSKPWSASEAPIVYCWHILLMFFNSQISLILEYGYFWEVGTEIHSQSKHSVTYPKWGSSTIRTWLLPLKWYAKGRTWVVEIGLVTLRQESFFLSEVFYLHARLASIWAIQQWISSRPCDCEPSLKHTYILQF